MNQQNLCQYYDTRDDDIYSRTVPLGKLQAEQMKYLPPATMLGQGSIFRSAC